MTVGATPLLPYHMDAPSFTLERSAAGGGGTWQNPFVERLIGSVRRECLNHVVILSECHLRRILTAYFAYYHRARTHLSLDKDAPAGRAIERPEMGRVVQVPEVGGLHHRYARQAA